MTFLESKYSCKWQIYTKFAKLDKLSQLIKKNQIYKAFPI